MTLFWVANIFYKVMLKFWNYIAILATQFYNVLTNKNPCDIISLRGNVQGTKLGRKDRGTKSPKTERPGTKLPTTELPGDKKPGRKDGDKTQGKYNDPLFTNF
jgi:hypothetical protein